MALTITSPYLSLVLPVDLTDPSTTPDSPGWGQQLQDAFLRLDTLLGTGGEGVVITSQNLSINADVSWNDYNLTGVRAFRNQNLSALPALGTDICEWVSVQNDGYYIDGNLNAIRITENGSLIAPAFSLPASTIQGTVTLQATDGSGRYQVYTGSQAAVINLPPASLCPVGRSYFFEDYYGASNNNTITIQPNSGDYLNATQNLAVVLSQPYGVWLVTRIAGSVSWVITCVGYGTGSTGSGLSPGTYISGALGVNLQYAGSTKLTINSTNVQIVSPTLQFSSTTTSPTLTQATGTGAGVNLTIQAQNAGGSNNNGASLYLSGGDHTGTGTDGYVFLGGDGYQQAFVVPSALSGTTAGGFGIGNTPGTDPTITRGTGVPTATQPNGSIFLRTDGTGLPSTIYYRISGAWVAATTGLIAPVTATTHTITTTYTIDNSSSDAWIYFNHSAAFNLTLPAPSAGRVLYLEDISGALETNPVTLVRHASENINGIAASRVIQANWGLYTLSSDGTNWYLR